MILLISLLVAGCGGVSKKDVVGVYMIRVDNASGTLDLKADDTYVQTVAITGTNAGARNGKWHLSKSGDQTFVILEKAFAVDGCPQCALTPKESVTLYVSAGEKNVYLAQDAANSKVLYAK